MEGFDESTTSKLKGLLKEEFNNKKIDINDFTDEQLNTYVADFITKRNSEINEIVTYLYGNQAKNISSEIRLNIENSLDAINRTGILNNLDEGVATNVRNEVMENILSNKVDLSNISANDFMSYVKQVADKHVVFSKIGGNTNEVFENFHTGTNDYGIDQGLFTNLDKKDMWTYNEIKDKLINEYKFSPEDSDRIMQIIDYAGACTYARNVNVICAYFKNMPEEFEEIFGFPLYKQDINGNWRLNSAELLMDYYIFGNIDNNLEKLFYRDSNGNLQFNRNAFVRLPDQNTGLVKLSDDEIDSIFSTKKFDIKKMKGNGVIIRQYGSSWKDIIKYLESKSDRLHCNVEKIADTASNLNANQIRTELLDKINNGEVLGLGVGCGDKALNFIDAETGKIFATIKGSQAHYIAITDVLEDGVIVSSWGKKCFVSFQELINNTEQYWIYSYKIQLDK